jgi:hypothetical protein
VPVILNSAPEAIPADRSAAMSSSFTDDVDEELASAVASWHHVQTVPPKPFGTPPSQHVSKPSRNARSGSAGHPSELPRPHVRNTAVRRVGGQQPDTVTSLAERASRARPAPALINGPDSRASAGSKNGMYDLAPKRPVSSLSNRPASRASASGRPTSSLSNRASEVSGSGRPSSRLSGISHLASRPSTPGVTPLHWVGRGLFGAERKRVRIRSTPTKLLRDSTRFPARRPSKYPEDSLLLGVTLTLLLRSKAERRGL